MLSEETKARFELVPEFAFIQEEANRLGVKVYLFGGTASAFAHYVRWDLEREAGDDKYQKERFDYDFTNIYRGNQDLDIVVDGTTEQAAQLQQILKEKYPHFVGDKDAWEVRLLQAQIGDKLPLLGDYDFLNQHTDTNSTGMLAINPDEGEIVFRDLFSWEGFEAQFLKDVANGEIKFLFSDTHEKTSRAKEGKNPPIFAAVRYLAKLAQYEVTGTPGDLGLIKKIVKETDWEGIKGNTYVKHKLEEFGKKVLLNAPDSEYAWNLLENVGLREKLIEMDGNQIKEDTLSWWMNKEPLRSKEIGAGSGKTASEIFKDSLNEENEIIVAHETNSFLAYENITRSSKGRANAFISRTNVNGEAAAFGDGFYTALGMQGARGTNLTIRFKLHPKAREGSEFIFDGGYIVVLNKNALTLIQENLNISMIDFLKLMNTGEINSTDKGLIEKFKRKFDRVGAGSQEFEEALKYVRESFTISNDFPIEYQHSSLKEEILSFGSLMEIYIEKREEFSNEMRALIREKELWRDRPDRVRNLINKTNLVDVNIAEDILSQHYWSEHSEGVVLIREMMGREGGVAPVIEYVLSTTHWQKHEKFMELMGELLKDVKNHHLIVEHVLSTKSFSKDPRAVGILKRIIKEGHVSSWILGNFVLSKSYWLEHEQGAHLFKYAVDNYENRGGLVQYVFSTDHWAKHEDALSYLKFFMNGGRVNDELTQYVLSSAMWFDKPETFQAIMDLIGKDRVDWYVSKVILSEKHWQEHPRSIEILEAVLRNPESDSAVAHFVLSQDYWANHPRGFEFLETVVQRDGDISMALIEHVFSKDQWLGNDKVVPLLMKMMNSGQADNLPSIITHSKWAQHEKSYDLILKLIQNIKTQFSAEGVVHSLLESSHWMEHPKKFDILHQLVRKPVFDKGVAKLLSKAEFVNGSDSIKLVRLFIDNSFLTAEWDFVKHGLSQEYWARSSSSYEVLMYLVKKGKSGARIVDYVLSQLYWAKSSGSHEALIHLINKGGVEGQIIANIFSKAFWRAHPKSFEIILSFLVKYEEHSHYIDSVFEGGDWDNHTELRAYLRGKPSSELFLKRIKEAEDPLAWVKKYRASSGEKPLLCKALLH